MRELRLRDVKSGSQSHTASTVHSGTRGRALAQDEGGSALLSLALEAVRYLSPARLLLMTDLKNIRIALWHFYSDDSWAVGATWAGRGLDAEARSGRWPCDAGRGCVCGNGAIDPCPRGRRAVTAYGEQRLTFVLRAGAGAPAGRCWHPFSADPSPGTAAKGAGFVPSCGLGLSPRQVSGYLCFGSCLSFLVLAVQRFRVGAGLRGSRGSFLTPRCGLSPRWHQKQAGPLDRAQHREAARSLPLDAARRSSAWRLFSVASLCRLLFPDKNGAKQTREVRPGVPQTAGTPLIRPEASASEPTSVTSRPRPAGLRSPRTPSTWPLSRRRHTREVLAPLRGSPLPAWGGGWGPGPQGGARRGADGKTGVLAAKSESSFKASGQLGKIQSGKT